MVNMCRFEIRVEQVYKDTAKAFPNGLYGCQTAKKQHSWPPGLPGITNSFKLKRDVPIHPQMNMNEALPGEFV